MEAIFRAGCRPPGHAGIVDAARDCLRAAGRRSGSVTILFTSDREIRTLNRKFRGVDRATDVLSFPWESAAPGMGYLGDVAISVPAARRYARKAGWPLRQEIRFLVLHGLLHLLGFDHEADEGDMDRLQGELARDVLGMTLPAARTAGAPGSARRKRPRRPA